MLFDLSRSSAVMIIWWCFIFSYRMGATHSGNESLCEMVEEKQSYYRIRSHEEIITMTTSAARRLDNVFANRDPTKDCRKTVGDCPKKKKRDAGEEGTFFFPFPKGLSGRLEKDPGSGQIVLGSLLGKRKRNARNSNDENTTVKKR